MVPPAGLVQLPAPIILMVVFALFFSFFLKKTIPGRRIYSIGGNEEATRISGVRTDRVKRLVYTLDTGYEVVDITNYEEVWASKTAW